MKNEELRELNKQLKKIKGTKFPNKPIFHGEALPTDAEEFDCIVFYNIGVRMDFTYFTGLMKALGYAQEYNPDKPDLEPVREEVIISKPPKEAEFKHKYRFLQIICAVDQNGPNQGIVDIDELLDEQEH